MTPDMSTSTMRPVERRPLSWPAAVIRSFRDALRPAAREELAWSAAGVLVVILLFWVGQGIAVLRESTQADLVMAVWFSSREEMTVWAFTIWVMAAPCVLLPRFALGEVADREEDPVLRHGLASGRILALQLPALVFALAALGLGVPQSVVAQPVFPAGALTLSAAAVAVAVNECRLWDFARRFLLRALGVLLFVVACFGRRYFGGTPLPTLTSLADMPIMGGRVAGIGGGSPFDVALTAFILLTCAWVITSLRSPAAPPDTAGEGLQALDASGALPSAAAEEGVPFADDDEGEGIRARIAPGQLDLDPGAGLRTALALAYDRETFRLLLATLPVLALMALCASGAMWLQRMPGGSLLTSLAGYPPMARNPLLGEWSWQWSQSGSFALLAAIAAWTVLAARLVVAPLAASTAARLRGGTDREAGILSGLSPFEMLTWASVPSALPVATVGLVGTLLAALPAYRDGAPTDVLMWVVLAGPAQTLLCGLVGVAVGLRARTTKAAEATARGVAGLGLPVGFLLLSWGLSLATRNPDATDRFLRSIGSAYQGFAVLSVVLGAEIAWWMLRRLRPIRAQEGGGAARMAWRVAAGALLALGWLSGPTSSRARHLEPAEQAFAAGDYRLAARLLRQLEPYEVPGRLRRSALTGGSSPSGSNVQPTPHHLAPFERALPTAADSVRPALAAAEYSAGRPDRARQVMDAMAAPAAGLAWPEGAESMPRAEVYRSLLRVGGFVDGSGVQLRTLNALIAREAAKAAPKSVEDRLAYARAIGNSSSDSPLPTAKSVFQEVLELDPTNKDALVACGRALEASHLYPDDLGVWRACLTAAGSPAEQQKALLAIIRLQPENSFGEAQELIRQTIAAGDFPKALRYLELVRPQRTSGAMCFYWKKRGWILAETGHIQEAIAAYTKARQDPTSWNRDSVLNYMALAYLQAGDIPHAREALADPQDRSFYALQDLFYTWCSDKLAPPGKPNPGAMKRRLAEEEFVWSWTVWHDVTEEDCTRQTKRILSAYPDCLPAAILLAKAIYDHRGEAPATDVGKRVRQTLAPFSGRFPQISGLQKALDPTPKVVRSPVAQGGTGFKSPGQAAQTPAQQERQDP